MIVTTAGPEAAGRFDEQAANPKAINRLDTNIATTLTVFPINEECTRKLENAGILPAKPKTTQDSKQSLIFDSVFTGKIVEISRKENLMPRKILFLVLFLALVLAACKANPPTKPEQPSPGQAKHP